MKPKKRPVVDCGAPLKTRNPPGQHGVVKSFVQQRVGQGGIALVKPFEEAAEQVDTRRWCSSKLRDNLSPRNAWVFRSRASAPAKVTHFATSGQEFGQQYLKCAVVGDSVNSEALGRRS